MMVVLSGLLAASLAIGLPVGSAYADEPTDGTGAGTSATEVLDSLEVKGRARKPGTSALNSARRGPTWTTTGCDTRNDILNRGSDRREAQVAYAQLRGEVRKTA